MHFCEHKQKFLCIHLSQTRRFSTEVSYRGCGTLVAFEVKSLQAGTLLPRSSEVNNDDQISARNCQWAVWTVLQLARTSKN